MIGTILFNFGCVRDLKIMLRYARAG